MQAAASSLRQELATVAKLTGAEVEELKLLRDKLNEILSSSYGELDDENVLFKGWLNKRKQKGNLSRPKRRFCILLHDGLHYFESPFSTELGFIESSDIADVRWAAADKKTFLLVTHESSYEMTGDDESGTLCWYGQLMKMKPMGFSLGSEEVVKEGYLNKSKEKGRGFSAKKKRFCVLDDYTCKYYDKKGGVMKGQLELIGLKLAPILDKSNKIVAIRLNCGDGSTYIFTASATDGDSMESWFGAFSSASLKLKPDFESSLRSSQILPGEFSRSSSFSELPLSPTVARAAPASSPAPAPALVPVATTPAASTATASPTSPAAPAPAARSGSSGALPNPPGRSLSANGSLPRSSSGGERQLPSLPTAKSSSPDPSTLISPKPHGAVLLPGLSGSPHQLRKTTPKGAAVAVAAVAVAAPPPPDAASLPPPPLATAPSRSVPAVPAGPAVPAPGLAAPLRRDSKALPVPPSNQ